MQRGVAGWDGPLLPLYSHYQDWNTHTHCMSSNRKKLFATIASKCVTVTLRERLNRWLAVLQTCFSAQHCALDSFSMGTVCILKWSGTIKNINPSLKDLFQLPGSLPQLPTAGDKLGKEQEPKNHHQLEIPSVGTAVPQQHWLLLKCCNIRVPLPTTSKTWLTATTTDLSGVFPPCSELPGCVVWHCQFQRLIVAFCCVHCWNAGCSLVSLLNPVDCSSALVVESG